MTATQHGMTDTDALTDGAARLPAASDVSWGNPVPLALMAFAVTTFMLSAINADWFDAALQPVVFGVALMFGGLTQTIAGLICVRTGNTFAGVLFSSFGAFWLSLFAIAEFELAAIPPAEAGKALGLFLLAYGIFTVLMFVASFRTNVIVVVALAVVAATFFVLSAGEYNANESLVHAGGYLGVIAAALAAYLACAEVCEFSYGRPVLPVGHLAPRAAH